MANAKERIVKSVWFNEGIQMAGTVKQSVDADKEKATITVEPSGVLIETPKDLLTVPYNQVRAIYYLKG